MNWLDADPPTWEWEHDPAYQPLRVRQAGIRLRDTWNAYANSPDTRWRRFLHTGEWEPRGPRPYGS